MQQLPGGNAASRSHSLRDVLTVLFRHKKKIIVIFLLVVFCGGMFTILRPEIYRSEAKLLVQVGRESVTLDPTVATGQVMNLSQSRESEVNSELHLLRSEDLLRAVIEEIGPAEMTKRHDESADVDGMAQQAVRTIRRAVRGTQEAIQGVFQGLDLDEDLADLDALLLDVEERLGAEVREKSNIIGVSFEAQSPRLAQQFVNTLVEHYLRKHIEVHQSARAYEFFQKQADDLRAELMRTEESLRQLKDEAGIASLTEQRQTLLEHIGTLEQEIGKATSGMAASQAKIAALKDALAILPGTQVIETSTGLENAAADTLRQRLYEMVIEEQRLLTNYNPESRQVLQIQEQIRQVRELLAGEEESRTTVTEGIGQEHQQVKMALLTEETTLTGLQAESAVLQQQLADAQERLGPLNASEQQLMQLQRELGIQEANYRRYSENLAQARIHRALEEDRFSNISVVQPATFSPIPIRPKKSRDLLIVAALALFLALGSALLGEYLGDTVRTPEEVENRLGLPFISSIPLTRDAATRFLEPAQRGNLVIEPFVTVRSSDVADLSAVVRQCGEVEHRLVLESDNAVRKCHRIAVTSCGPGEGVTTVAANLASALAVNRDVPVLLMDLNLDRPRVHELFSATLESGLAHMLTDSAPQECITQATATRNLHVLTAGERNGKGVEGIPFERLERLLATTDPHFRFAVIDLPPLSENPAAARLAALCDGVILVVQADHLRSPAICKAAEHLVRARANIAGVVLNKRRYPIPGWLYSRL